MPRRVRTRARAVAILAQAILAQGRRGSTRCEHLRTHHHGCAPRPARPAAPRDGAAPLGRGGGARRRP
eukprot:4423566-Lingulodinium_polyedra.AAC.1